MIIQCEKCGHKSTRTNFLATHDCTLDILKMIKRKRKPRDGKYSEYMLAGVHVVG